MDDDVFARIVDDLGRVRLDLSPAERLVIQAAAAGLGVDETAVALGKDRETVKRQREHAYIKLRAKNAPHAVAIAIRAGIIT